MELLKQHHSIRKEMGSPQDVMGPDFFACFLYGGTRIF